ncbi:hypothetical protein LTR64_006497 [Lithohypha guttulata]|uniref:uncharacterized protein n=1 Tax=Lithohypha guttulata TaxID=1690604 RepID=UPI002DDF4DBC|nr:hypothetical protein LTR51_004945 [Lithohypha guttulata]
MAIIEQLEMRVRVAKTPLPEYDLPDEPSENVELQSDTTSVIQKCIESQPDQNFDVEMRLHPGFSFPGEFDVLACTIYIDGVHTIIPLLMQQKYQPGRKALVEIQRGVEVRENGNAKLRKFRFANLQLSSIKICVFREKIKRKSSNTDTDGGKFTAPASSEKNMKGRATDSFTTLDEPEECRPHSVWHTVRIGSQPLAEFIFFYYTRVTLQKIDVIPQSPSPIPLEDRPRESLSREELLQLIERQQTVIEAGKKATKKEQLDSDMEQLERVKRSQSDEEEELEILPQKRARKNAKIQVIDILDD